MASTVGASWRGNEGWWSKVSRSLGLSAKVGGEGMVGRMVKLVRKEEKLERMVRDGEMNLCKMNLSGKNPKYIVRHDFFL